MVNALIVIFILLSILGALLCIGYFRGKVKGQIVTLSVLVMILFLLGGYFSLALTVE